MLALTADRRALKCDTGLCGTRQCYSVNRNNYMWYILDDNLQQTACTKQNIVPQKLSLLLKLIG